MPALSSRNRLVYVYIRLYSFVYRLYMVIIYIKLVVAICKCYNKTA